MGRFVLKLKKPLAWILTLICIFAAFPAIFKTETASAATEQWTWPVPGSYVVWNLDYYYDGSLHSQGQCIDIGNNGYNGSTRLTVVSATSGVVDNVVSGYADRTNASAGWGNRVVVAYQDKLIVYAHLKSVSVKIGQKVSPGTALGKMGTSGLSYGVHLHFQVYPASDSYRSTKYKAFDFFKDTASYIQRFSFQPGCAEYSRLYYTYLRTYFSKNSDGYWRYNGAPLPQNVHTHSWGAWTYVDEKTHKRVCSADASHVQTGEHTWDAGTVVKRATATAEGSKKYTCTVCGGTKTVVIPKQTFTVYYHADTSFTSAALSKTTKVAYGTKTKLFTLSELGLSKTGYRFTGWRIYREIDGRWLTIDANGNYVWLELTNGTLPKGYTFHLIKDGGFITKAATSGKVHLCAQWEPTVKDIGDIDGDGDITAADARLALRLSVALEVPENKAQLSRADLDGDGDVSALDARLILRNSIGLSD